MSRSGETDPGFGWPPAGHAFSLEEALYAYSVLPAKAMGMEKVLGTLEKGKLADLVVFSHDMFSLSIEKLLTDVHVDLTLMDGNIVFIFSLSQGFRPR
jgi:predicted amidohydrolase YtcJ